MDEKKNDIDNTIIDTINDTSETKQLASIEIIENIKKHPDADSLWILTVQDWEIILNCADPESLLGKKIIYVQVESIMPPIFDKEVFWKYLKNTYLGKKVTTAKLRGVYSQGLVIEFDSVKEYFPDVKFDEMEVGTDVTNILGITKYYSLEDPENPKPELVKEIVKRFGIQPNARKPFPEFLLKTDQPNLRSCAKKIKKTLDDDRTFTATYKYDGQSVQWFRKGDHIGVCSRNYEILLEYEKPEDKRDQFNQNFREMEIKYNIFDKLALLDRNLSIQIEMYGPKINGNRHKMKNVDIVVFDIFDIDTRKYLSYKEMKKIADTLGLPVVKTIFEDEKWDSDKWFNDVNNLRYPGGLLAEGMVIKTSDDVFPYLHFKVLSQAYSLKND